MAEKISNGGRVASLKSIVLEIKTIIQYVSLEIICIYCMFMYIYILLIYTYLPYTKAIVYCKYNLCTCIFNAVNHACLRSYTYTYTSMHLQPHMSTISFQLMYETIHEGSDAGRQSKEHRGKLFEPQVTSHLSKWHWSSLPLKIDGMMDFLLEPSYFSFRRVFFQWKLNGSMVW